MKKYWKFSILLFFLIPTLASAFTIQSASDINIGTQDKFEENLYLVGGKVNVNDEIKKDLFLVGGNSDLNGNFFEDVQALVGNLKLSGEIKGDARIFGGDININSKTNQDLFVVAGKVNISPNAQLDGKNMIIAGEVNINGKIYGDLKIISAKTNINSSEIYGNSEITSQKIQIGNGAKIFGDLTYFSPQKAIIDSGAKFEKEIIFNQIEKISENSFIKKTVLNTIIFWTVIKFLASLFIAFILVFVFKIFSQRTSQIAAAVPIKSFFVGLLSLVLIPFISIVLFASLFAIPVSIIFIFAYTILLILTAPVSGMILGFYLKTLNKKENYSTSLGTGKKLEVDFNSATLGIVILTFISFVPWVGEIVRFIFLPLSFGAMMLYYSEIIMKKKATK